MLKVFFDISRIKLHLIWNLHNNMKNVGQQIRQCTVKEICGVTLTEKFRQTPKLTTAG